MAVVYRYIDLLDNTIKYVGIVYSDNRTLDQRISEHENDAWYKQSVWRIEYLDIDINSRTDAEMLEAHYISEFGTDKYFNKNKANWGISQFVDEKLFRWSVYKDAEIKTSTIVIAPFFSRIGLVGAEITINGKKKLKLDYAGVASDENLKDENYFLVSPYNLFKKICKDQLSEEIRIKEYSVDDEEGFFINNIKITIMPSEKEDECVGAYTDHFSIAYDFGHCIGDFQILY